MKKLFFIFAVALSTGVNAQPSTYAYMLTDASRKFMDDNGFEWYCSPYVRYCVEMNDYSGHTESDILLLKSLFKTFSQNNLNEFKRISDTSYIMTYSEYLDSKSQYNPTLNISRMFNLRVKNITSVPSANSEYIMYELVEMYNFSGNTMVIGIDIFALRLDGTWVGILPSYPELECEHCPSF